MSRLAVLLAVASLLTILSAQDQPPRPVFRTEANYVRVDVFPTANAVPVTDLRQEDFEILEDKAAQKIEQFEHVVIRGAGPQESRREPNTVAQSRQMLDDPRARVFVLFLDTYHVGVAGSHNIRKPLVEALDRIIGQDDLVGVMTPDMSATNVTFARKTVTVDAILSRYWYWGERDRLTTVDPEDDRYRACYPGAGPTPQCSDDDRGVADAMIERRREKRTLDALEDLVRFLRGVREERKAILAVSDGWRLLRPDATLARQLYCRAPGTPDVMVDPRTGKITTRDTTNPIPATMYECDRDRLRLSQIDDEQEFRDILDQANRANASFYPIDPRGLPVFDSPIDKPLPLAVDAARLRDRANTLRTLAEATDGIAIVGSNDLTSGLRRVVDDLSSYYLLGYYSTGRLDGRFHSITVRVKRPGVQVRARRGYLAATQAEMTASRSSAASATGAQMSSAAAAEAGAVAAAIAPLAAFTRELPIRLQASSGWKPGNVAVIWTVGELGRGEDTMAGGEADVMLINGSGATLATARARLEPGSRSFRVALTPDEPLPPGDYDVRVRVRNAGTGALPSSDAFRIAVAASPNATGAVFIRRGPTTGNKDVPTADLRFRRGDQVRVEVPTPTSSPTVAKLLDRTGKPIAVPVTAAVRDDADGSRWQTAQLSVAPLAAGDYIIELSNGSGTEQKRTLLGFRVVP